MVRQERPCRTSREWCADWGKIALHGRNQSPSKVKSDRFKSDLHCGSPSQTFESLNLGLQACCQSLLRWSARLWSWAQGESVIVKSELWPSPGLCQLFACRNSVMAVLLQGVAVQRRRHHRSRLAGTQWCWGRGSARWQRLR